MTHRYDTETLRHEIARLRAAKSTCTCGNVLDESLAASAMASALTDVRYAMRQVRIAKEIVSKPRGLSTLSVIDDCCQRALDGLERAEAVLTVTATVPTSGIGPVDVSLGYSDGDDAA